MTSLAPSEVARIRSRFAARSHSRTFWIAWWAAAIAGELLALRPFITGPVDGIGVVFALVGGSFCAFGLIAWHRRPDSLSGALMTATGFLFFAAPVLGPLEAPLAFTVYVLVVDLWIFPFVALLLTFLTAGRLQPGVDRWLVASFALPVIVLQAAWLLTADLVDGTDLTGKNLLLVFPDADFAHAIDRLQRGSLALLGAVTVVVIVARWLRASGPRRRALLPSLAGAFALACFAALLVNDLISGTRSQFLLWCAACSLVAVPAAFLAGLLRARLARGGLASCSSTCGSARGADAAARARPGAARPGARARLLGARVRRLRRRRRRARRAAGARRRPRRHARRARRRAGRRAGPRRLARRRPRAASRRSPPRPGSRSRTSACRPSLRRGSPTCAPRARGSSSAGDAERRRLERDLHDGAQQRLVALSLQLRLLAGTAARRPGAPSSSSTTAREELAASLEELRELARGIHPAVLDHGLAAGAASALAARADRRRRRSSYERGRAAARAGRGRRLLRRARR